MSEFCKIERRKRPEAESKASDTELTEAGTSIPTRLRYQSFNPIMLMYEYQGLDKTKIAKHCIMGWAYGLMSVSGHFFRKCRHAALF